MRTYFIFSSLLLTVGLMHSQGCSDAGICSLSKSIQSEETTFKNSLELSLTYALGEADLVYVAQNLGYTKRFNTHYSFTARVTFSTATGSFGTRSQFGDAFLIGNYAFQEKDSKQWTALLGAKFPFTASNLKINGFSLPLDYQSSLGTIDIFLGSNYRWKKWDFNAALQLPVVNLNKNSYFKEYSGTEDFPSTNLFRRQPDALLRASYTLHTKSKKIIIKPNLLAVYHLGEDSFETIFGQREKIKDSDGLTINGNVLASYSFSNQRSIELSLATPFLVRTVRPDGLTRSFVATIHYQYSF